MTTGGDMGVVAKLQADNYVRCGKKMGGDLSVHPLTQWSVPGLKPPCQSIKVVYRIMNIISRH